MTVIQYVVGGVDEDGPPDRVCGHLGTITDVAPTSADGCEDCLRERTRWVHLRACLQCGHVGCCDNSPRRHATAHWHATAHPLIRSVEPGEDWAWCYADDLFLVPASAPEPGTTS
jgi:CPA1 family monovalent cation:H+ antiporter